MVATGQYLSWTFVVGVPASVMPARRALNGMARRGPLPTVLRVADGNWHAWLSDTWPPQAIWHFQSVDGIQWQLYGRQPEIPRTASHGHAIKCLRAYVDHATGEIVGLISVWGDGPDGRKGWVLHESRMPASPR